MKASVYALAAIALWATLASLGVSLRHVPPYLLTGLALLIGSALSWPFVLRDRGLWKVRPAQLALGVFTLFGFHFLLFIALRLAPAVEVNLVNYLWPLLIVLLTPLYLSGVTLHRVHFVAAAFGFGGAALAILSGQEPGIRAPGQADWETALGYALALGSALIWANYSLQTKRAADAGTGASSAAIGLYGLLAGLLSLLCHAWLEPAVILSRDDALMLALLGLGPLGAAFFLWDQALKLGDLRQIGILSYLTPLASTLLLMLVSTRTPSWNMMLALAMVIGATLLVGVKKQPTIHP